MLVIYDAGPYMDILKDLVAPNSTLTEYVYYYLYREYHLNSLITAVRPHHITRYGRVAKLLRLELNNLTLDQLKLGYERTVVRVVQKDHQHQPDIHIILGERNYDSKVTDNRRIRTHTKSKTHFDVWFK